MRKLFLMGLLIGATIFTGCGDGANPKAIQGYFDNNMKFFKNEKAKLCFAYITMTDKFTNVPCTPEVEALINKTP